jgi:hypothetical protein
VSRANVVRSLGPTRHDVCNRRQLADIEEANASSIIQQYIDFTSLYDTDSYLGELKSTWLIRNSS